MKRMHVHIAVHDLNESIRFYSAMFGSEPSVTKPDYAKWMLEDPKVNFAISRHGAPAGLNHLGIQVEDAKELAEMHGRLQTMENEIKEELGTACCYAKSDKYWATDPQGIAWETYHTLDSIPMFGKEDTQDSACCMPVAVTMPSSKKTESASCC